MRDYKIIFNHQNFKKIEENIWVIEKFLTKEECQQYVDTAESTEEEVWWSKNSGWYDGKYLDISNRPIYNTVNLIAKRFQDLFEYKEEYHFGAPVSIHRIHPGQGMFVHADFTELDNLKEEYILFNGAMYHNEFEGGALFYPELGIEYKPSPGDLVMHPGTSKYKHGVTEVIGTQTRYMSNIWVADKLGYSIKTSGNLDMTNG